MEKNNNYLLRNVKDISQNTLRELDRYIFEKKAELSDQLGKLNRAKSARYLEKKTRVMLKKRTRQAKRGVSKSLFSTIRGAGIASGGIAHLAQSVARKPLAGIKKQWYRQKIAKINNRLGCEFYDCDESGRKLVLEKQHIQDLLRQLDTYHAQLNILE